MSSKGRTDPVNCQEWISKYGACIPLLSYVQGIYCLASLLGDTQASCLAMGKPNNQTKGTESFGAVKKGNQTHIYTQSVILCLSGVYIIFCASDRGMRLQASAQSRGRRRFDARAGPCQRTAAWHIFSLPDTGETRTRFTNQYFNLSGEPNKRGTLNNGLLSGKNGLQPGASGTPPSQLRFISTMAS